MNTQALSIRHVIVLQVLLGAYLLGYVATARAGQEGRPGTDAASGYAVQVGAFGDAANAERRLATVESFVDEARIFSGRAGTEARFFVIAGIFSNADAAQQRATLLRGFGIDTFIRPLSDAEARIVGVPNRYVSPNTSGADGNEDGRQKAVEFLQRMICQPPLCLPDQVGAGQARPEKQINSDAPEVYPPYAPEQ